MSASGQTRLTTAPLATEPTEGAEQPRERRERSSAPEHDVSVVIPCRNESNRLPRQLDALAAQDFRGTWEIVVADNGSTDDTAAVAHAHADRFPSLRVVDASARPGRHHACNVGIADARGRVVLFVDADDTVAPDYVTAMTRALHDDPVVAARLDHATLDEPWMDGVGSAVQDHALQPGFGFLPFGAGCSLGFRREVLEAVGGFREDATYCEDVDLCWRAHLAGFPLQFAPDAVVHYQSRPNLRAMFRQHRQYAAAQAYLFRHYRAAGMPPRALRTTAAEWWAVVRALPRLRSRTERARWARRAGRCVGRVQGSLRHRVWYV